MTKKLKRNHKHAVEHWKAWRPPRRPNADVLFVLRSHNTDLPPVRLQLIDVRWVNQYKCEFEIAVDDECYIVNEWPFSQGWAHDLPLRLQLALAGVLPPRKIGDDIDAYERLRLRWKFIVQQLLSDRALWMIVTFAVRRLNGQLIDDDYIQGHMKHRDGAVGPEWQGEVEDWNWFPF